MRVFQHLAAIGAGAIVICACTTMDGAGDSDVSIQRYDDCFFARSLSDWRPLDDQNLIAFTAGRRPYHVVLFSPAFNLNFEQTIGFYDRDGRICPFDEVLVNGVISERVQITSIRRLTDEQLEETYVQFGIRPPEVIIAPEEED